MGLFLTLVIPRSRCLWVLLVAGALFAIAPVRALASAHQVAIFQDYHSLLSDPSDTLQRLRSLGVQQLRLPMLWDEVAPRPASYSPPKHFNASNPASYPRRHWAIWDQIIEDAGRDGIRVNLDLDGYAPLWATGPGRPHDGQKHHNWEPSPRAYGQFAHAVGERYSGNYDPVTGKLAPGNPADLPRISFWSFWNEPNLGFMLAPQGVPGRLNIENSGRLYRPLLNAAWTALRQTGHGHDTTLIGEVADKGGKAWGVFASMKPLVFLRALYCVDSNYRELRGAAAAIRGCPTTAAGSKRFRASNPALFQATGFADHMWARWYPPNRNPEPNSDYTDLAEISQLERALDRLQAVYGSTKRFPIYNTEFGYITDPPNRSTSFVSPATAAYYLNWAEYISWRNPRIASFEQYLLRDPPPKGPRYVGWSSGLLTYRGREKVTYDAWRLPLYLPVTSSKPGAALQVWGCVRPANFAIPDTGQPQNAALQFRPSAAGSHWSTLATVTITQASNCYFNVHIAFPAGGMVRLAYTYPAGDPRLPHGQTVYSRQVSVKAGQRRA